MTKMIFSDPVTDARRRLYTRGEIAGRENAARELDELLAQNEDLEPAQMLHLVNVWIRQNSGR